MYVACAGSRVKRLRAWRFVFGLTRFSPNSRIRAAATRPSTHEPTADYITAGIALQSLLRIAAWLRHYLKFASERAWGQGLLAPTPTSFHDNDHALDFLAVVAAQNRGRSRVAAAVRALEFLRRLSDILPLSADPRTALLKKGVLRAAPHAPKGAVPFLSIILVAVMRVWGGSRVWWKRMVACILAICFLSLLRGAGVLSVPAKGVTWVNGLVELVNPHNPPKQHSGVLLLVPSRKSRQTAPSWIPLRAGWTTRLLARHVQWHSTHARSNAFLFPSRRPRFKGKATSWRPHRRNAMSTSSLMTLMRQALCEVCGLSPTQAGTFTFHSLRVGGINHYRRLGVSIGMRAKIAAHKSLATSRKYLRLLPFEQFDELNTMVPP